jgi:hypothetical protein
MHRGAVDARGFTQPLHGDQREHRRADPAPRTELGAARAITGRRRSAIVHGYVD